jgi:hypothetical protein
MSGAALGTASGLFPAHTDGKRYDSPGVYLEPYGETL